MVTSVSLLQGDSQRGGAIRTDRVPEPPSARRSHWLEKFNTGKIWTTINTIDAGE